MRVWNEHTGEKTWAPRAGAQGFGRTFNQRLLNQAAEFRDDEDGATLVFSMCILVVILMVAGLAVDVAIYEDQRARMQQTADRAVLAAADLDQKQEATLVVEEYFAAAGLGDTVASVTVTEGLNFRRVEVDTLAKVNTYFTHMVGVDEFEAPAKSGAEERVTDVEISLIVDVSGSMGSNNRMTNLKTAAEDFFNTVIDPASLGGLTSISVIPYNHVVNSGEEFLSYMNATTDHEESHCIRFYDDDFDTVAISPQTYLERVAHFHYWQNSYNKPSDNQYWCKVNDTFEMMIHETNATTLTNYVNALTTGGWTAIDNGMKWGMALLDPAMRPTITAMVNSGTLPPEVAGRPIAYESDEIMKVIVLMTDGANTDQRDLHSEYKFDMSGVYYSPSSAGGKEFDENSNFDGFYAEIPGNTPSQRYYRPRSPNNTGDDQYSSDVPGDAFELSNAQLYTRFSLDDAAYMMWYNSDGGEFDNRYWDVMNRHDRNGQIDQRLKDMCDTAKATYNRLQIFSIGFEAPQKGQDVMKYCATAPGHFYDINGTDISNAFASIASTINRLRLIQ